MTARIRKLGRGLDSLIRRSDEIPGADGAAHEVLEVAPQQISMNRDQPRRRFDEASLAELAESIRSYGFVQPLVVRALPSGSWELIAGERRLRAALQLGLEKVPILVRETASDLMLETALIENIQREDLNPMELARAYVTLKERRHWSQAELAEHLGKKRSSIANTMRYIDLPTTIQEALEDGRISEGHVKVLLSVSDSSEQLKLFEETVLEGLTVRLLEDRVFTNGGTEAATQVGPAEAGVLGKPSLRRQRGLRRKDPAISQQEQVLATHLSTRVTIRERRGRGRILIDFYSLEDFERLRDQILLGPRQRPTR